MSRKPRFNFPRAKLGVDTITIPVRGRAVGRRLDQYLQLCFPGYSRSFLQGLIKDKRVQIEGRPTKASRRVIEGEQVVIHLPEGTGRAPAELSSSEFQSMPNE